MIESGGSKDYELGVLVVHGIGNQRRGQTLTQWADALVRWLESWSVDEQVTWRSPVASITEASLQPVGEPAHLTMKLRFEPDDPSGHHPGAVQTQRWLLAEGWWAGTFEPPTFGELWSWSFVSVPATAAMHANAIVRSAVARFRFSSSPVWRVLEAFRILAVLTALIGLVMISPVILAVFTVLLVAGLVGTLIPIDAVRLAVAKAQLAAIGTIGDTKRLTGSPTQAGAIKAPIVDGLRWLREAGCERVVIVAHSQGAAVSYKALADLAIAARDGDHEAHELVPVDSLVTVGSGLPKVHALEHLGRARGLRNLRTASLLVPICAVAASISLRELERTNAMSSFGWVGVAVAVTAVATLWTALRKIAVASSSENDEVRLGPGDYVDSLLNRAGVFRPSLEAALPSVLAIAGGCAVVVSVALVDRGIVGLIAAVSVIVGFGSIALIAADEIPPIPNDLYRTGTRRWLDLYAGRDPVPAGPTITTRAGWPNSWRVSNLGSIARDHNTYTSNTDECLTFLGVELLELANVGAMQAERVRQRTANYGFVRRWRVGWRMIATWVGVVSSTIFALRTWADGPATVAGWYEHVVADGGPIDRWSPIDLPSFVPRVVVEPWDGVMAVGAYLVVATIVVQVAHAVWSSWDRQQSRQELGPGEASHGATPAFVVLVAALALWSSFAVAPGWVGDWWSGLDLRSWSGIGRLVLPIVAAVALAAGLPAILRSSRFQDWVMHRYNSRVEARLRLGDWQLSEGHLDRAHETFGSARLDAKTAAWGDVHASAGLLRVRNLLRQRAILTGMAVSEDIDSYVHRCALVEQVTDVRGVSDRARVAAAVEWHLLGETKRARGQLGRVRPANRRRADHLAAELAVGDRTPADVDLEKSMTGMLPDQQMQLAFAMLAKGDAGARRTLDDHLAAGHIAPDLDLRAFLPADADSALHDLARQITGLSVGSPVPADS